MNFVNTPHLYFDVWWWLYQELPRYFFSFVWLGISLGFNEFVDWCLLLERHHMKDVSSSFCLVPLSGAPLSCWALPFQPKLFLNLFMLPCRQVPLLLASLQSCLIPCSSSLLFHTNFEALFSEMLRDFSISLRGHIYLFCILGLLTVQDQCWCLFTLAVLAYSVLFQYGFLFSFLLHLFHFLLWGFWCPVSFFGIIVTCVESGCPRKKKLRFVSCQVVGT